MSGHRKGGETVLIAAKVETHTQAATHAAHALSQRPRSPRGDGRGVCLGAGRRRARRSAARRCAVVGAAVARVALHVTRYQSRPQSRSSVRSRSSSYLPPNRPHRNRLILKDFSVSGFSYTSTTSHLVSGLGWALVWLVGQRLYVQSLAAAQMFFYVFLSIRTRLDWALECGHSYNTKWCTPLLEMNESFNSTSHFPDNHWPAQEFNR